VLILRTSPIAATVPPARVITQGDKQIRGHRAKHRCDGHAVGAKNPSVISPTTNINFTCNEERETIGRSLQVGIV
jgi:hypothetical protein